MAAPGALTGYLPGADQALRDRAEVAGMAARAISILVLLMVAFPAAATSSDTRDEQLVDLAPADAAAIEWARGRFAAAALELPDIDIVVFDDLLDCGGHVGMYHPSRNLLELCRLDKESVLHELAHAWADLSLDDARRQTFVEHRGVGDWNEGEDAWKLRATEHAAEIIVWALMDRDTTVKWVTDGVAEWRLLTIPDSSPERLAAGFELLTGRPVPEGRCMENPCDGATATYPPGR
jgi:hypothetical protein